MPRTSQHAEPDPARAPRTRPAGFRPRRRRRTLRGHPGHRVQSHPAVRDVPQWGWGTDDATEALSYLRRFSSVTCLNGHVHQLFTKTEGNVTFHSATTTAYPLPQPGRAPAPTPVTLPAGKLRDALGIREVSYRAGTRALAIKDRTLT